MILKSALLSVLSGTTILCDAPIWNDHMRSLWRGDDYSAGRSAESADQYAEVMGSCMGIGVYVLEGRIER